jgi:hypothetical protein
MDWNRSPAACEIQAAGGLGHSATRFLTRTARGIARPSATTLSRRRTALTARGIARPSAATLSRRRTALTARRIARSSATTLSRRRTALTARRIARSSATTLSRRRAALAAWVRRSALALFSRAGAAFAHFDVRHHTTPISPRPGYCCTTVRSPPSRASRFRYCMATSLLPKASAASARSSRLAGR